jgi:hypothetical protein
MKHLEIILAPRGEALIETYCNGQRTAISRALPREAARIQARETKLTVIDHTRTG